MFRYLKAAFFVRPRIPGLGYFPINVLGITALAILGFAHPAFWLLGIGLETAFLFALATNKRFQALIDGQGVQAAEMQLLSKRQALVLQLGPSAQKRLADVHERCQKILGIYRTTGAENYLIDNNAQALRHFEWVYLKLLVSLNHLESPESRRDEEDIDQQIRELEKELANIKMSPSIRDSKQETLELLRKRLEILNAREQTVAEIRSDLVRIDAQIDLVMDQAVNRGRPQAITSDLQLASQLLDNNLFGDSGNLVADLEESYGRFTATRTTTTP